RDVEICQRSRTLLTRSRRGSSSPSSALSIKATRRRSSGKKSLLNSLSRGAGEGRGEGLSCCDVARRSLTLSLSSSAAILAASRLEACSTGGEGTYFVLGERRAKSAAISATAAQWPPAWLLMYS